MGDLQEKKHGLPAGLDSEGLNALIERQTQLENIVDKYFKRGFAAAIIAFVVGAAVASLV